MSLRSHFDSFTSQHKLRDAEEEYVQATYRFRAVDEAYVQNWVSLAEMEFLLRVEYYRYCVYSGQIESTSSGLRRQTYALSQRGCSGRKRSIMAQESNGKGQELKNWKSSYVKTLRRKLGEYLGLKQERFMPKSRNMESRRTISR